MRVMLAVQHRDLALALQLFLDAEPDILVVGTVMEAASLRALLRTADPDLVILDWDLPGTSAPAHLVTEARQAPCHPHVIVVGRDVAIRHEALAAGAAAFVLSGDPPGDLIATVRQCRLAPKKSEETDK